MRIKLTEYYKVLAILGIMLAISIITAKTYLRYEKIRISLEFGHLAKLPDNSKNVLVETSGSMFSRTCWLTFESSEEEIDKWLNKSNELKRKDWETRDKGFIAKNSEMGEWQEIKDEISNGQPDWFNPEDLANGELYEVIVSGTSLYGKVWVDRKNKKVFIRTSYS